jgi:ketosteroid isomerase-like protein
MVFGVSGGIDRAALVRDHFEAFNARDLRRLIDGLSETVVWRTGRMSWLDAERLRLFFGMR